MNRTVPGNETQNAETPQAVATERELFCARSFEPILFAIVRT
jgi:hypothetical protein